MAVTAFKQAASPPQARQAHGDPYRLLAEAIEARSMLERYLQAVADHFECDFEVGPVKSLRRSQDKASANYNGDLSGICDFNRGMLIVPDERKDILLDLVNYHHPDHNANILQFKNKLCTPTKTGFRSCNVYLPMENGHVSEVMILTRSMRNAYSKTHDLFEKASTLSRTFGNEAAMPGKVRSTYRSMLTTAKNLHDRATPAYLQSADFVLAA